MQKNIIITMVAVFAIISGCTNSKEKPISENPTPEINSTTSDLPSKSENPPAQSSSSASDLPAESNPIPSQPTTTQEFNFVKVGAIASCTSYELQDKDSNKIDLPKEIQDYIECPLFTSLSPDNKFLIYEHSSPNSYIDLNLYNLITNTTEKLMSFNNTREGISCTWNNSNIIACVVINQSDYPGLTKIFILEIDENGKLIQKKNFPQKQGETIDFECGASCYPGKYWFENQNTIKYEGHKEISPDKIYTIKY